MEIHISGTVRSRQGAGEYEGAEPPVFTRKGIQNLGFGSLEAVRMRLELATPGVTGRYSKPTELPHQSFQ